MWEGSTLGLGLNDQNCEPRGDNTNYLNRQGSVEPYAPGCPSGCPSLWWAFTSVQMPQVFIPLRTNCCPKISLNRVQHLEVIFGHVQVAEGEVLGSYSAKMYDS